MKKAKLIFLGLSIFCVFGGLLAFKAHKQLNGIWTSTVQNLCLYTTGYTTTSDITNNRGTVYYTLTATNTIFFITCPNTTFLADAD